MNILVTAANGNLGSQIVSQLALNHNVTAGIRNLDKSAKFAEVNVVNFDYDNINTYTKSALEDYDAVVLQAPPLDSQAFERLTPFIAALEQAQIKRVVFISAFGVNHNDQAPLRKIELSLIDKGFDYTFIRPNFFMENFTSGFALGPLEHDGIVLSSAGDGKLAFVSIKDIAAVVASVFSNSKYINTEHNLTGPQTLSHQEVADVISKNLNKNIAHVSLTGDELKAGAVANGLPESAADYLVMLYELAAMGLLSHITNDVEQILDRAPLSFDQVYAD